MASQVWDGAARVGRFRTVELKLSVPFVYDGKLVLLVHFLFGADGRRPSRRGTRRLRNLNTVRIRMRSTWREDVVTAQRNVYYV